MKSETKKSSSYTAGAAKGGRPAPKNHNAHQGAQCPQCLYGWWPYITRHQIPHWLSREKASPRQVLSNYLPIYLALAETWVLRGLDINGRRPDSLVDRSLGKRPRLRAYRAIRHPGGQEVLSGRFRGFDRLDVQHYMFGKTSTSAR